MSEIVVLILKCVGMGIVGFLAGMLGVRFFNKMPAKWLTDYGKEPSEELKDPSVQRIKTYPWKFVIGGFFTVAAVKLTLQGLQFAVPALVLLWALFFMAAADKKYMIVPDQLILIMLAAAFGFIPVINNLKSQLIGAGVALVILLFVGLLGKLIYKRDSLGGADIKIYTTLGLALGLKGFAVIFIMTTFISAGHFAVQLIRKKAKRGDIRPLVPYLFIATAIYLLILYPLPVIFSF